MSRDLLWRPGPNVLLTILAGATPHLDLPPLDEPGQRAKAILDKYRVKWMEQHYPSRHDAPDCDNTCLGYRDGMEAQIEDARGVVSTYEWAPCECHCHDEQQ